MVARTPIVDGLLIPILVEVLLVVTILAAEAADVAVPEVIVVVVPTIQTPELVLVE